MSSVTKRPLQHVLTVKVVSPLRSGEELSATYLLGNNAHAVFDAMCGAFRGTKWTKTQAPLISMSALLGGQVGSVNDSLIVTAHTYLAYQVIDSVPLKTHFGLNDRLPAVDAFKDPLHTRLLQGEEVDLEGADGALLVKRLSEQLMSREYALRSPQGYLAALRLLAQLPGQPAREALIHLHNHPPYLHSSNGKPRVLDRKEDDDIRLDLLVNAVDVRDFVEMETAPIAACENELQLSTALGLLQGNLDAPIPKRSPGIKRLLHERLQTLPFRVERYREPVLDFLDNLKVPYKPKGRAENASHAHAAHLTARTAEGFPLHQLEVMVPPSAPDQPPMNAALQVPAADAHDLYRLFTSALRPQDPGEGLDPMVTMTEVYAPPGERVGLKKSGEQTFTPYLHAWLGFEALRMHIDPAAGVLPLTSISQELGTQDLLAADLELTPSDHDALVARLQDSLSDVEYAAACPEGYLAALQLLVRIPGENARDAIFQLHSMPPFQLPTQNVLLRVEDEKLRQDLLVSAVNSHRFIWFKLKKLGATPMTGKPDETTRVFQLELDRFSNDLRGMWKRTPNLGDVVLQALEEQEFKSPTLKALTHQQLKSQFDDRGFLQETLGALREALGTDLHDDASPVGKDEYARLIREAAAALRPRMSVRAYLEETLKDELGKTFRRSTKLGSDIVRDLRSALKPTA